MLSRREGHDDLLQLPEIGSFHLSYGYMQILLFFKKKKNPRLALAALECHVMNGNRNCALVSGPLPLSACCVWSLLRFYSSSLSVAECL